LIVHVCHTCKYENLDKEDAVCADCIDEGIGYNWESKIKMKPTTTITCRLREDSMDVGVRMDLMMGHPKDMSPQQFKTFFILLDRVTSEVKIKLGTYLTEMIEYETNKKRITERKQSQERRN